MPKTEGAAGEGARGGGHTGESKERSYGEKLQNQLHVIIFLQKMELLMTLIADLQSNRGCELYSFSLLMLRKTPKSAFTRQSSDL